MYKLKLEVEEIDVLCMSRAQIEIREYIEKYDLGSNDIMNKDFGIIKKNNKIVAYVSYNGRLWDKNNNLIQERI